MEAGDASTGWSLHHCNSLRQLTLSKSLVSSWERSMSEKSVSRRSEHTSSSPYCRRKKRTRGRVSQTGGIKGENSQAAASQSHSSPPADPTRFCVRHISAPRHPPTPPRPQGKRTSLRSPTSALPNMGNKSAPRMMRAFRRVQHSARLPLVSSLSETPAPVGSTRSSSAGPRLSTAPLVPS